MTVRRRLVHVVISALIGLGLASGQLAVAPAEAASPPKLTFKTKKVKVKSGSCKGNVIKYKVPVLKGSTKANRSKVEKWGKWVEKAIHDDPERTGCYAHVSTGGEVYKGRYLSVGIDIYAIDVKALNLDLKTGKTVKRSKFASTKGGVFDLAVCKAAFRKKNFDSSWCSNDYPSVYAWRVTVKGVWVYSAAEGEPMTLLIPWKHIVKPDYDEQKKYVTKNVPTQWYYRDTVKPSNTKVTVQGNLVTVKAAGKNYYGVRGMGEVGVDGKLTWLPVFAPGELGEGFVRHAAFKSKKSNTAVRYTSNIG